MQSSDMVTYDNKWWFSPSMLISVKKSNDTRISSLFYDSVLSDTLDGSKQYYIPTSHLKQIKYLIMELHELV
jgi:hypothetical protein